MALENDASCVEALYNLGLCNKKLGMYEDALEIFFKLQTIVRNHSQVKDDHIWYQSGSGPNIMCFFVFI